MASDVTGPRACVVSLEIVLHGSVLEEVHVAAWWRYMCGVLKGVVPGLTPIGLKRLDPPVVAQLQCPASIYVQPSLLLSARHKYAVVNSCGT